MAQDCRNTPSSPGSGGVGHSDPFPKASGASPVGAKSAVPDSFPGWKGGSAEAGAVLREAPTTKFVVAEPWTMLSSEPFLIAIEGEGIAGRRARPHAGR